jgi:hypothetical protein
MAIVTLEVPDHEVAFVEKQLLLMGYSLPNGKQQRISAGEKLASPAQKTMLKAFEELRASFLANPVLGSTAQLEADTLAVHEKMWGPGL